ncbi:flagellar hook-associated protein FlgL [Acetivibrio cellulolyticus]|uniref:flagellar hook-associated protein FlgL n=1 Tax=Acetivibrio cellulolyticus TaxID=35830 RepID=UPI0001E30132|nr:flagellar hook-associated protein FlgL [Acetivibrio cellulolyticus]
MRITNNMLVNNMINNIGSNLTRMDKYQEKLATGKKITVPSDDPVVAARALKLRTDVSQIKQHKTNVNDAMSWLEITESALTNVGDILQRARELAVQGSSSSATKDDTQKIEQEVAQLRNQLIQVGNSTYAGRYVFSGFKTDTKLINDDGTFAIDVDNTESIIYEIGVSDNININVTGGDLFNAGGVATTGSTGQLVQTFDKYISSLNSGNHELIGNSITDLDNNINNLLRIRAGVGARYNRLELTSNRLDNDEINFTKLMSENEDVDQAENIMLLKSEENVYKASLSGGAKIIQTSLVDFLK